MKTYNELRKVNGGGDKKRSMDLCFICGKPLTKENASDEHIILNALGGHLHSRKLLCKTCNSKMGQASDAELSKELEFAASFLDIKRQRGENQVIQTHEDELYDMGPGGKPVLKKPVVHHEKLESGVVKVEMKARSMEEAKRILKGLKKTYPVLDVEEALKTAKPQKKYLGKRIGMEMKIDGPRIFPSVTKSVLEFYLLRGGERSQIVSLIPYVMGEAESDCCWYYYPPQPLVEKQEREIFHVLYVVGDPKEQILYGYMELFGILQCMVCLNDHYTGADFCESYGYDVVKAEEIKLDIKARYSKEELQHILKDRPAEWTQDLFNHMRIFLKKADDIVRETVRDKMLDRAIENSFKKHPEGIPITEEMMQEFLGELEKELIPWYVSRMVKND